MYPVHYTFSDSVKRSHNITSRADLYRQGELIVEGIPIISGTLTDDSTALIRRRAQLEIAATADVLELLPQAFPANGGLWPLGNELKIYAGVVCTAGNEWYIPQGVFRIANPKMVDTGTIAISMDAYDRSRSVSRSRFTSAYVIEQGTNYVDAIKTLIQSRVPWLTDEYFQFMTTSYVTPQLIFTNDDDPWEKAVDMAASLGAELFFDGDGICVLQPENNPLYTEPDAEYFEGEDMTLTEISRDLNDDQAYNGVIVTGENSDLDEPLRAEAWDTDPTSPTYYDPGNPGASVYGAVPYYITSQYIYTQQQCQDAADANLTRVKGIMERLEFTGVNNPAHTSNDVISVRREQLGVEATYIIESLTRPLGLGTVSGTTKKRRVT